MPSRTQSADLDAWFGNTLGGAGNGNGNRAIVGMGTGAWAWLNRAAVRVPRGSLFDGIPNAAAISAFRLKVRVSSGLSGIGGSVKIYAKRGTSAFTEIVVVAGSNGVPSGGNINQYVISAGAASGHFPGPTTDPTNQGSYQGSPAADSWISIDCLELGKWWFAHPEVSSLVLVLQAFDETATAQRVTIYTASTDSAGNRTGSIPYVEIVYGTNSPPNAPGDVTVTPGSDGQSFTVSATYTDPDGDKSPKYEVMFTPD